MSCQKVRETTGGSARQEHDRHHRRHWPLMRKLLQTTLRKNPERIDLIGRNLMLATTNLARTQLHQSNSRESKFNNNKPLRAATAHAMGLACRRASAPSDRGAPAESPASIACPAFVDNMGDARTAPSIKRSLRRRAPNHSASRRRHSESVTPTPSLRPPRAKRSRTHPSAFPTL